MSTIHIGVIDLSFHRTTASLIIDALHKMHINTNVTYAPHQQCFENLKNGKVDMLVSAWLPFSHGAYKQDIEQITPLLELGKHYTPYALWGIPDYIPQSSIHSILDLLKDDVICQLPSTIYCIEGGAGITAFLKKLWMFIT